MIVSLFSEERLMTLQRRLVFFLLFMIPALVPLAGLEHDAAEPDNLPRCCKHLVCFCAQDQCREVIRRCFHLIPGANGVTCNLLMCKRCGQSLQQQEFVIDAPRLEDMFVEHLTCPCKDALYEHLGEDYGGHWADNMSSWGLCGNSAIYRGYFYQSRYSPLFAEYLCFFEANPCCTHLWPELSPKAAAINNIAYDLFSQLFAKTALRSLLDDDKEQWKFTYCATREPAFLARIFVDYSFFFSSYEFICRDLENYSASKFCGRELEKIQDRLNRIRETLAPLFLDLYQHCPPGCQSRYLTQESTLIQELCALQNQQNCDSGKKLSCLCSPSQTGFQQEMPLLHREIIGVGASHWVDSELHLCKGIFCSGRHQYPEAIDHLTRAVQLNPHNQNALIERALCYLETEELPLALRDYHLAKSLHLSAPIAPEFYTSFEWGKRRLCESVSTIGGTRGPVRILSGNDQRSFFRRR